MGLDTVELVLNVEDAFDVKISDDKLPELKTVGDLYEYILAQTQMPLSGNCLTASAFYELRAGFADLGITVRIAPSTKLVEILPRKNRRQLWQRLSQSKQLKLPNLVRPNWITSTSSVVTITASVFLAYVAKGTDSTAIQFSLVGIVCLFVFGYLIALLTEPFATSFDKSFQTFRGLSERVLALNRTKFKNEHGPLGRNDIWVILREIIADTLGVDHDEITRGANFIRDLGCE
jgi:acyl carrier protein